MAQFGAGDLPVIVGHVGRKRLRFARVDRSGFVLRDHIRTFEAASNTSISGAIATFLSECGLQGRAVRAAIAIAGLVRGDSISVTQTRWFVARSGLHAMLGHPPMLLNDFEAQAWALATGEEGAAKHANGTWCVAGVTSGLGVSVFKREGDTVAVGATEAGHMAFAPPTRQVAELMVALFPGQIAVPAEALISASGLIAAYRHLAVRKGEVPRLVTSEAIIGARTSDPSANHACLLLTQAFAAHLGNLVLAYGAWDGVILSGGLAGALHSAWSDPEVGDAFAGSGKYARLLSSVPRSVANIEHAELIGAAAALRAAAVGQGAGRPVRPPDLAEGKRVPLSPVRRDFDPQRMI